jgi:hypothetical protein
MILRLARLACVIAIVVAILAEAVFVFLTGAWLPEVPHSYHLTALVFVLTCASFARHRKYPKIMLIATWANSVVFLVFYLNRGMPASGPSFWQANQFPTLLLVASHIEYVLRSRKVEIAEKV